MKIFFLCDWIPSNSSTKAIEGVIKGYLSPFLFFFLDALDKKKKEEPHIWRITVFCDYLYVRGDSILRADSSTVSFFFEGFYS